MLLENWSDKVSVYWDFSMGPVTFIANIMLIIIILKYTPDSTKAYSSIILSITFADCASLIGNFMTSARVIPRDTQLFMIFRGACVYCFPNDIELKSKYCLYWYAFQIHLFIVNHMILIFSYIYRVIIITNPMKKLDNTKPVYIGIFFYVTLHFCYFNWVVYKAFQPMDTVNQAISKYEPDIVGSGATYYGIVDLSDPSQVVFNFLSITSPIFVIVVAVLCHWRIVRFSKKFQYSAAVKKLHRSLEIVFFAQTLGPILSFIATMMYVGTNQGGVSTHTTIFFENLMSRPMVLMFSVNPIVTFLYISPYRKALRKWLRIPEPVVVGIPSHVLSFLELLAVVAVTFCHGTKLMWL
ncbi:unnamed protein product [Caenorhabditis brenneri]